MRPYQPVWGPTKQCIKKTRIDQYEQKCKLLLGFWSCEAMTIHIHISGEDIDKVKTFCTWPLHGKYVHMWWGGIDESSDDRLTHSCGLAWLWRVERGVAVEIWITTKVDDDYVLAVCAWCCPVTDIYEHTGIGDDINARGIRPWACGVQVSQLAPAGRAYHNGRHQQAESA